MTNRESDQLIVLSKAGEPLTGGSGWRSDTTGTGNIDRTRRAGAINANLTVGNSEVRRKLKCGSESDWGSRRGKTARRDLGGERRV